MSLKHPISLYVSPTPSIIIMLNEQSEAGLIESNKWKNNVSS